MLLYFTGNGNSRAVAEALGSALGERVVRIAKPWPKIDAATDHRVVWVMPVYCWGIPPAVVEFMDALPEGAFDPEARHFLVLTCGDDVGMTHRNWRRMMEARGYRAASTYSVQMPNTYVILPGFDVDSPELTAEKLAKMPERVAVIAASIARGNEGVDDVVPGGMPRLKSAIHPLWRRYDIKPQKFRASDACVGCGRCSRSCPLSNIVMADRRPSWGDDCTQCLACYNCCPVHAIGYGRRADGKGQYFLEDFENKR